MSEHKHGNVELWVALIISMIVIGSLVTVNDHRLDIVDDRLEAIETAVPIEEAQQP
jgi:hypothetical protein